MSKRYNIRWSESDNQELRKAVKNFNAKITRLEKKYPDMKKALPEKVQVKQMKELIGTRQDLKRELNALRRFSRKGAEEFVDVPNNDNNLKITKWQKNEMTRRAGIINKKRKAKLQELSEVEMTSRGKKLGYTRGEFGMGRVDNVALSPMKPFTKGMYYTDIHKKYKVAVRHSQSNHMSKTDMQMVQNYIDQIEETFGNDARDIIDKIKSMPFLEFYRIIIEEDPNFEHPYPVTPEEYQQELSALRSIFLPDKYTEDYELKLRYPERYSAPSVFGETEEDKKARVDYYMKLRGKKE